MAVDPLQGWFKTKGTKGLFAGVTKAADKEKCAETSAPCSMTLWGTNGGSRNSKGCSLAWKHL